MILIVPLIAFLIIAMIMIFTDFIIIINVQTAETHFQPFAYTLFSLFISIMLVYTTFSIYHHGIKKSEGESRKRMVSFLIGITIFIAALINDAIGNIIEIEVLFDTILFILLSLGMLFIGKAFYGKKFEE